MFFLSSDLRSANIINTFYLYIPNKSRTKIKTLFRGVNNWYPPVLLFHLKKTKCFPVIRIITTIKIKGKSFLFIVLFKILRTLPF